MKKKILFIIWSFTAGGGAEKILANVANNLNPDKYEIDILEIVNFNINKEKVNDNINLLNPILIYNDSNYITRKISNLKSRFLYDTLSKNPSKIRNKIINKKYDIEISFNYLYPTFLLSDDSEVLKLSWIHSSIEDLDYRSIDDEKERRKIQEKYLLQEKHLEKVNHIVTISDKTYNSVNELYPKLKDKNQKIYNGYDFKDIEIKREENTNIDKKKNTIITVSKIDERKNISLLIEAAKLLKEKSLEFNIDIIGEGLETNNIKKLIKEYGLDDEVTMHGFKSNPYPYMKNADVYCLTSFVEGFPTVLVESMSCGCPFVSTKVAGLKELNPDEHCGISVDWDANSVADALELMLTNQDIRIEKSKNCMEIVKKFTLENQIKDIEKLLDN